MSYADEEDELNPRQTALLKEFRKEIEDVELDDEQGSEEMLVRWLRAKDWKIADANYMLRRHLDWRTENEIDNILNWKPPATFKCRYEMCGQDNDGSPVILIPYGQWNVREVVEHNEAYLINRLVDRMFAEAYVKMKENSKTMGRKVTKVVIIGDLTGFKMNQLTSFATVDSMMGVTKCVEHNYPEILKACYVINAPRFFSVLHSFMKPLLSNRTMTKIKIYGSSEPHWKRVLLRNIREDQLPTKLGGTNDGINIPKVLSSFEQEIDDDDGSDNLISCTVDVGDKRELRVDVKFPNSIIRWCFKTEDFDIGFSITYNDFEVILPFQRCDSHMKKCQGSVTCAKPGKYMVIFDNTCNRIWAKTLHCMVTVKSPIDYFEDEPVEELGFI